MEMPHSALWTAFEDGRRFDTVRGVQEMHCRDIGAIRLLTGRIIACDPQFDLVQEPFSFRVPPGEYPVFLSLVGDDREIALTMIQFNDGEPTRWVPTKPKYFSVDSSNGCIMDAKLARMLIRAAERDRFDRHWKRVADQMEENDGLWANVCLHADSGMNIIAFKTLGGDGAFESYLGYSEDNQLVCLVTDFFLGDLASGEAT
ncbi:MAG: DUF4241 domain-containing protein [Planctomycetaceae bacterium]|nr:DUF4241 domain-containing protein [Planctomycetaceae bacterium]